LTDFGGMLTEERRRMGLRSKEHQEDEINESPLSIEPKG
jgi:hypothetical protein